MVCEAIQDQTYKATCFGEWIKPCKLLSDIELDSFRSLKWTSQTQGS